MENYTIYCTAEQTMKALDLGAPIDHRHYTFDNEFYAILPTAEQMIGWLEEQGIYIHTEAVANSWRYYVTDGIEYIRHESKPSRKEAILAAIDAALDYLEKE